MPPNGKLMPEELRSTHIRVLTELQAVERENAELKRQVAELSKDAAPKGVTGTSRMTQLELDGLYVEEQRVIENLTKELETLRTAQRQSKKTRDDELASAMGMQQRKAREAEELKNLLGRQTASSTKQLNDVRSPSTAAASPPKQPPPSRPAIARHGPPWAAMATCTARPEYSPAHISYQDRVHCRAQGESGRVRGSQRACTMCHVVAPFGSSRVGEENLQPEPNFCTRTSTGQRAHPRAFKSQLRNTCFAWLSLQRDSASGPRGSVAV